LEHPLHIVGCADIAIANNLEPCSFFGLCDAPPVGLTAEQLRARARMDGNHVHPAILCHLSDLQAVEVFLVPP
jgi:hypothetical protein